MPSLLLPDSADRRQAQARSLDESSFLSPPLAPFESHGERARVRLAFEPEHGGWDDLWLGPVIDLARLLIRPWRGDPGQARLPGSVLLHAMGAPIDHDFNICALNMTLAARLSCGAQTGSGGAAIDAGFCWIALPSTASRAQSHFVRKDGAARAVELQGQLHFPQDQEAQWTTAELEAASAAIWKLCLATAEELSVEWRKNPAMSQAARELGSSFELGALEAATPKARQASLRKPAL